MQTGVLYSISVRQAQVVNLIHRKQTPESPHVSSLILFAAGLSTSSESCTLIIEHTVSRMPGSRVHVAAGATERANAVLKVMATLLPLINDSAAVYSRLHQ